MCSGSRELNASPRAAAAPSESEQRFRKIFQHSHDAIFVIDPDGDRIVDVNPRACQMLGFSRSELLSLPVSAIHPREMDRLISFTQSVTEQGSGWTNELTCLTKAQQTVPVEMSASTLDIEGRTCILAMVRDISERRRGEQQIKHLIDELRQRANYDPLTGLPNRAVFYDRLEQAIRRARRGTPGFCVVALDLNRFKLVNDCYGHQRGDGLLIEVGARLSRALRDSDTGARLGGDEFGILLPTIARRSAARDIAATLVKAFSQPFAIQGRELSVGSSMGLALYPLDGQDLHELLRQADAAMYEAKRAGTGYRLVADASAPLVA